MKPPKLLLSGILFVALAGASLFLVIGWRWWLELAEPPPVKPLLGSTHWSPPRDTVPLEGIEATWTRDQAAHLLRNPDPATPTSVERGKQIFMTYCAVCHGREAQGDGTLARKMVFPPPELPSRLGGLSDGYLYATIRNGGFIMPPYSYRISPQERWDLVNYLRTIQESESSDGRE